MSFGVALYFPSIRFRDANWLKCALLYWDSIRRIRPEKITPDDGPVTRAFIEAGLIEDIDPSGNHVDLAGKAVDWLGDAADRFWSYVGLRHPELGVGVRPPMFGEIAHRHRRDTDAELRSLLRQAHFDELRGRLLDGLGQDSHGRVMDEGFRAEWAEAKGRAQTRASALMQAGGSLANSGTQRTFEVGPGKKRATESEILSSLCALHVVKFNLDTLETLTETGIGTLEGNMVWLKQPFAKAYLLCVATSIAESLNTPLVSDTEEADLAGSLARSAFREPVCQDRSSVTEWSWKSQDIPYTLARFLFPVATPADLASVSPEQILRFRQEHEGERIRFRQAIERAAADAAQLEDPIAARDFLLEQGRFIGAAVEQQRKSLRRVGIEAGLSLASLSVPVAFTATGTLAAGVMGPIAVPLSAGLGVAVSFTRWLVATRAERADVAKESDWGYLLSVERGFDVGQAATRIRTLEEKSGLAVPAS